MRVLLIGISCALWAMSLLVRAHEHIMKHVCLRPVLEWWVRLDQNWSLPVGKLGKGLKEQLPPELGATLEHCYAGASIEDNWAALFATIELLRQMASEVAANPGYSYPHALDRRVTAYAQMIQQLERE